MDDIDTLVEAKVTKPRPPVLHPKIRIGTCKGNVNFRRHQVVFHEDDVPKPARHRKKEVDKWRASKILANGPTNWNKSTDPHVPLCERRSAENFVHDRSHAFQHNFRAEELVKVPHISTNTANIATGIMIPNSDHLKLLRTSGTTREEVLANSYQSMRDHGILGGNYPRTLEQPNSFKLLTKQRWNPRGGTAGEVDDKDRQRQAYRLLLYSRRNSARISRELESSGKYTSPVAAVTQLEEEIRKQKREGTFSLERRVFDTTDKTVDRSEFRNHLAVEKPRLSITREHTGVWQLNPLEGRYMWSDNGSYDYFSAGDKVKIHNLDRKNYGALTLEPTTLNAPRRINLLEKQVLSHTSRHSSTAGGGSGGGHH